MKIKNIYQNIKTSYINESGLSRIWSQVNKYEIALLTAFRGINEKCAKPNTDIPEGESYSKSINLQRNRILKAKLLSKGYGVTAVDGTYIENFNSESDEARREVSEDSFFVINLKNDTSFKENIIQLGVEFCQDSVLIKEPDGFYFYGTNNADWPGLNQKDKIADNFLAGVAKEFMSKVKNRPFAFTSKDSPEVSEIVENLNTDKFFSVNSRRLISKYSKMKVCCK